MKKRLLFVLTVIMLMCVAAFSASATNCNELGLGHVYQKTEVVKATCTTQGYDVYTCTRKDCNSFTHDNFVAPTGHEWKHEDYVFVDSLDGNDFYKNVQSCTNAGCTEAHVTEGGDENPVRYYSVEFINGHALDKRLETVKVESYGKTYNVPVDYTVLAETTKNEGLQTNYVKQGSSITYVGKKPVRTKDVKYGEYRFIGWTKDYRSESVIPGSVTTIGSNENYKITVKEVTANTKYYAAWEGVDVSYKTIVYNSDGRQVLIAQNIKHGSCIDYPYSYPERASETSVDFVFKGWEIGTKTAAGDQYNFYPVEEAHIKHIPIFSGDAIKAVHGSTPRIYRVDFLDAYGKSQGVVEVAYGDNVKARIDGKGITYGNYSDDTYVYEYKGYWESLQGQRSYLESFTVPKGSVDYDDPIYLKDVNDNYFKTVGGENLEVEQLHDYYDNQPGYFNKEVLTYVFPVTRDGDYIINSNGKALCLVIDSRGINEIDANGNRVKFDATDAENLRNVKVKPAYYQRVIDRTFTVKIDLDVDKYGELTPDDYKSGLVVQVTNEHGQLLASGVTKDWKCDLTVTKAEMYNITVVSPNEKYFAEKGVVWSVFKAMYDKKDPIIMNLELNGSYSEEHQSRCNCICHNSFFRGICVRVLNLLYRLFGVKYVCCYDMYLTLGDLLAYTK